MNAVRRKARKLFTPNAKSVCRIEEGSANAFTVKIALLSEGWLDKVKQLGI